MIKSIKKVPMQGSMLFKDIMIKDISEGYHR